MNKYYSTDKKSYSMVYQRNKKLRYGPSQKKRIADVFCRVTHM